MSQILHIFQKDLKHHWPEICLLLALVAYTWKEPSLRTADFVGGNGAEFFLRALSLMLLLAWGLLIVRVVQGESLVGDRQLWVTRPYEWPKLLVAKALFVVALVNVPWFTAQVILLAPWIFARSTSRRPARNSTLHERDPVLGSSHGCGGHLDSVASVFGCVGFGTLRDRNFRAE